MLNKLIEWWARNPVAANLLMIGLILIGGIQATRMEREMFPTIPFNGVQVEVVWPGAAPLEVEEQLVIRIEEAISDLDNIDWVRSFASENQGSVSIRTFPKTDMTQFMNDVKNRIDSISSFPSDIEQPRVFQWVNREEYLRVAVHGDIGEKPLKRLAEELRKEVAKLPSISLVELFGVRSEEVSIEVNAENLQRYNLSLNDISNAIRRSSLNLSSGSVRTDAGTFTLSIRNMADTKSEFSEIIVRQTPEGGIIRVGDVATVIDGFEDQPILATMNGEPAVLIQVQTTETMNITEAADNLKAWLKDRRDTLPKGVQLTLWNDASKEFNGRIDTISSSALQGLILVLIVLLLTLRPQVALWVTVGIATAYFGAFVFLPAVGVSINMLSTFAFLLVLGIVVDDAIVVGESIHTESQKTGGGITAAVLGTQLVAKPVIFAVLTTIIAFLPWLMFASETAEFTKHITYVVIFALSFSLIESLLILPAHLRKLTPRTNAGLFGRFQKRVSGSITTFAENIYRPIAQWVVMYKWLTTSLFFAFLVITFVGIMGPGYVKTAFDAEVEAEEIVINVNMQEGNSYSRSLEVLDQLQRAQERLVTTIEAENEGDRLIENWYTRSRRDSVIAIVKLVPAELRTLSAKDAALKLREEIGDIPDAQEVTVRFTLNNPGPDLEFAVRHKDLDILRLAVADLEEELQTFSEVYDVRNNLQAASDEIRFTLKPGAEQLGLTLADVSRQVRQAYWGEEVQRLPRDGQDVKVMVRYTKDARSSIESLSNFRVRTTDGREVPLLSVAEISYAPGIKNIQRRDQRRTATISANLRTAERDTIMKSLEDDFFEGWEQRYPGVERGAIGQAEGQKQFFEELLQFYLFAFFLMYMLLAIAFKSYGQPVLFLIAIPFAVVGAIVGHLVMGETMAIFSYFGIAAAAGVVINDNLVLVDYCNKLTERGMNGYEAIVEAGVARFRPILLTTVTTIVGLVPMMLEKSTQAAFLQPVVIALAFGVGIAIFVTLLLVPALYVIGLDFARYKSKFVGALKRLWCALKGLYSSEPDDKAKGPITR